MLPLKVWQAIGSWRAKGTPLEPEDWFVDWVHGGSRSKSGERVSVDTSMQLSTVYACTRNRSDDVAKLPLFPYRRIPGGGRERATDHPTYRFLHDSPNPRMTAMQFRSYMQMQLDLRGNAYAWLERDGRGKLLALWPLSHHVQPLITADGRQMFYRLLPSVLPEPPSGLQSVVLPPEEVLHLCGPSLNGFTGMSIIAHHKETIGLALAAQNYGAAFFGNSAIPKGGLEVPNVLQPDAASKLRDDWERRNRGAENAGRLAIFDGGMKWVQTSVDQKDAQYIESRKYSREEIAALWRMPLHKIGDLERATFANIEHQSLEYAVDCLQPELTRWEQTMYLQLLTEQEQATMFFEHLLDALIRGDITTRYAAYAVARTWGILSADECREMENRNKVPGGGGETYLQPLNMAELGTFPAPATQQPNLPAPTKMSARALVAFARQLYEQEKSREQQTPKNGNGQRRIS